VFCNGLNIGRETPGDISAGFKVAYHQHELRERDPALFQGQICNTITYFKLVHRTI
jgi:hypothetical protein